MDTVVATSPSSHVLMHVGAKTAATENPSPKTAMRSPVTTSPESPWVSDADAENNENCSEEEYVTCDEEECDEPADVLVEFE